MDTPKGLKILEFQLASVSGFSGWASLTNKNMGRRIAASIDTPLTAQNRDYVYSGGSHVLKAACFNKAVMHSFFHDIARDLFPKQKTYAHLPGDHLLQSIAEDFESSDGVVIKIPDCAMGKGVFFLSGEQLRTQRFPDHILRRFAPRDGVDFFNLHAAPVNGHFLVQEAVIPYPIEKDGVWYRPTTRVVAKVSPKTDGGVQFYWFGMYHKLPGGHYASYEDAVGGACLEDDRDKLISKISKGGPAKVSLEALERISMQMEAGLTPLFKKLMETDHKPFVLDALRSTNPGDQVSAMMALLSHVPHRTYGGPLNNRDIGPALIEATINNPYMHALCVQYRDRILWMDLLCKKIAQRKPDSEVSKDVRDQALERLRKERKAYLEARLDWLKANEPSHARPKSRKKGQKRITPKAFEKKVNKWRKDVQDIEKALAGDEDIFVPNADRKLASAVQLILGQVTTPYYQDLVPIG